MVYGVGLTGGVEKFDVAVGVKVNGVAGEGVPDLASGSEEGQEEQGKQRLGFLGGCFHGCPFWWFIETAVIFLATFFEWASRF